MANKLNIKYNTLCYAFGECYAFGNPFRFTRHLFRHIMEIIIATRREDKTLFSNFATKLIIVIVMMYFIRRTTLTRFKYLLEFQ